MSFIAWQPQVRRIFWIWRSLSHNGEQQPSISVFHTYAGNMALDIIAYLCCPLSKKRTVINVNKYMAFIFSTRKMWQFVIVYLSKIFSCQVTNLAASHKMSPNLDLFFCLVNGSSSSFVSHCPHIQTKVSWLFLGKGLF
jgi:hypothetical protein